MWASFLSLVGYPVDGCKGIKKLQSFLRRTAWLNIVLRVERFDRHSAKRFFLLLILQCLLLFGKAHRTRRECAMRYSQQQQQLHCATCTTLCGSDCLPTDDEGSDDPFGDCRLPPPELEEGFPPGTFFFLIICCCLRRLDEPRGEMRFMAAST